MTPRESLIEVMKHFDALWNDGQQDAVRNMEKLQKALSDAQKVIDATEDEDEVPCPDCDPILRGTIKCSVCHFGGHLHSVESCTNPSEECPRCQTCHGARVIKRGRCCPGASAARCSDGVW
jgi:NAD(P)H-nitrite reductase large subunit